MTTLFANQALLPSGWVSNARVIAERGVIASVEPNAAPAPDDERVAILIPAMPNVHSHAFQRGMAGLAETRGPGDDSFWSWREVMYRFALTMTPEQVESVAAQLYVEMLEAGFGRVGEFHYLHHDKDGGHYTNIAEMAERIAAAAVETGIGLTLLPVFYAHSGFGGLAPNPGQRQFINDISSFERLLSACRKAVSAVDDAVVGVAPHSLRAVTPDELAAMARTRQRRPASYSHRRADARSRGLHRLVWRTAGRVAARQCTRKRQMVPHPCHPHVRRRDGRNGEVGRGCRSVPDHRGQSRRRHLPCAPIHCRWRRFRHRLGFQRVDRRLG